MIKCSECGANQHEGTLFCSECGGFLLETSGTKTAVLPFSEFADRPPPPLSEAVLKPAQSPKNLTFVIPSSRRRIIVELYNEMRVGRSSPDAVPEPDLTLDDGAEKGVSRLHATIKSSNQGVVLIDLDSTNGTLLNTYRLPAHQPYPLSNGDEIRFGDLLVHLFFDD
jgi:hypothetical protein